MAFFLWEATDASTYVGRVRPSTHALGAAFEALYSWTGKEQRSQLIRICVAWAALHKHPDFGVDVLLEHKDGRREA
eukprot:1853896-Alexandrium_andersonii.AAC.1